MGFAQPVALWLLIVLPVVVLLHQLRTRSAVVVVPSLQLWQQVAETTRAEVLSRRWQWNMVLVLQVFAIGLGILTLARPYVRTEKVFASRVVFVLDVSGSMKARDIKPSRFDVARERLLSDAKQLPRGTRFALVLAGNQPRIALGFSSRLKELRRVLSALRPTDEKASLVAATTFAKALAQDGDIWFYTDTPIEKFEQTTRLIRAHPNDIALTELTLSRNAQNPTKAFAHAKVENRTTTPQWIRVTLDVEGIPVDALSVKVDANASEKITFSFRAEENHEVAVTLALETEDDDSTNNRLYGVLTAIRPIRVLIVGETNPFLTALLRLDSRVKLRQVSPKAYLESDEDDLIVFYRAVPAKIPPQQSLFIAPSESLPFAERLDIVSTRTITGEKNHPLTRFCDFSAWSLRRAIRFAPTPTTRTLVMSENIPLVIVWEKTVLLAFDAFNLRETDFPLKPLAVVFFTNLIEWVDENRRVAPTDVVAGEEVSFRTSEPNTVLLPDGNRISTGNVFNHTENTGIYRVFAGERLLGTFAVNPPSDERSDVVVAATPPIRENPTHKRQGRREIWRIFAIATLGFLLAEWWVFHRR